MSNRRIHDGPVTGGEGLPWQAFAIVGDRGDPLTWQLPHHTRAVERAVQGKKGYEHTVDWLLVEKAVLLLSRRGDEGKRVSADPEMIIQGARHLAGHYQKAGRVIPDALCALL
jgi:hypothetical protein